MSYAWTQDLPISAEMYGRIRDKLRSSNLDGLQAHMAIQADEGVIRYIDVWESREHFQRAMDQVIHPAVFSVFKELGVAPMAEPARNELSLIDFRTANA